MPPNANSGQRDLVFLKFAAELQKENPEFASWISRQAMDILKRQEAKRKRK